VIATAVGGVPELIADGETGLLHRHKDHAELAAKILSLLNDETCAFRLGIAGLHLVKMRFTKEQFAANMANLYRHMLRIRKDAGQACVTVDSVSAV